MISPRRYIPPILTCEMTDTSIVYPVAFTDIMETSQTDFPLEYISPVTERLFLSSCEHDLLIWTCLSWINEKKVFASVIKFWFGQARHLFSILHKFFLDDLNIKVSTMTSKVISAPENTLQ